MSPRKTATAASRNAPADIGLMFSNPMAVQMTGLRLMADASRTMASCWPVAWLAASSPFFWAPPLWVLAMMAGSTTDPHGGVAGSTATKSTGTKSTGTDTPPGNKTLRR